MPTRRLWWPTRLRPHVDDSGKSQACRTCRNAAVGRSQFRFRSIQPGSYQKTNCFSLQAPTPHQEDVAKANDSVTKVARPMRRLDPRAASPSAPQAFIRTRPCSLPGILRSEAGGFLAAAVHAETLERNVLHQDGSAGYGPPLSSESIPGLQSCSSTPSFTPNA